MNLAGLSSSISSISPAPMLDAWRQPWRQLLKRRIRPSHRTAHGRIYAGNGEPVIVLPAFGHGPESTAKLREILTEAGFAAYDWGMGADLGPRDFGMNRHLRRLEEQLIDVFEAGQSAVSLLGWGLSGIYAREVAKRTSPLVRQVITLGTPFNTAADPQHECAMLHALQGTHARMEPAVWQRLRQRPPVPCTSIYSMSDGVIPWELCVETETPTSENIEIPATAHLRLARHPKVLEVVSHRLSQPEDEWQPFQA